MSVDHSHPWKCVPWRVSLSTCFLAMGLHVTRGYYYEFEGQEEREKWPTSARVGVRHASGPSPSSLAQPLNKIQILDRIFASYGL
jgi:hypothetical protein